MCLELLTLLVLLEGMDHVSIFNQHMVIVYLQCVRAI